MEHHLARNLQHEILQATIDMFDQSKHILHTMQKILCLCISYIFSFLEIKYMLKMLLFILSSILKWLHENLPVLISCVFFESMTNCFKKKKKKKSSKCCLPEETDKRAEEH